jgi:hypothetical protein
LATADAAVTVAAIADVVEGSRTVPPWRGGIIEVWKAVALDSADWGSLAEVVLVAAVRGLLPDVACGPS